MIVLQDCYAAEKREVRQFQLTAWPDHGVPDHPTPLLFFMRRVKSMTPPECRCAHNPRTSQQAALYLCGNHVTTTCMCNICMVLVLADTFRQMICNR